jgi:hypothetical protein
MKPTDSAARRMAAPTARLPSGVPRKKEDTSTTGTCSAGKGWIEAFIAVSM